MEGEARTEKLHLPGPQLPELQLPELQLPELQLPELQLSPAQPAQPNPDLPRDIIFNFLQNITTMHLINVLLSGHTSGQVSRSLEAVKPHRRDPCQPASQLAGLPASQLAKQPARQAARQPGSRPHPSRVSQPAGQLQAARQPAPGFAGEQPH